MKNISILGSTGSIGVSTLDVIVKNPSKFRVLALSAGKNLKLLKDQIDLFKPKAVSVLDEYYADQLVDMLGDLPGTKILWGDDGYREVASFKEADMVVSAIVGAAGLLPTVEAMPSIAYLTCVENAFFLAIASLSIVFSFALCSTASVLVSTAAAAAISSFLVANIALNAMICSCNWEL